MQHETKMENQSWLKKLARRLGPGHVVNLCFIVVLLFSTLLTWREVVVLEDAYISSQRNHLENVANALDKHLQYNVDKLIFLRNGMREALVAPLDFISLRNAVTEFEQHRDEHAWQIELNRRRTMPVNGVSDALVSEGNLLSRENESLDNEITAALEVGYLLRLAHNSSSMVEAKYILTPVLWKYLYRYAKKHQARGNGFGYGMVYPNNPQSVTRTLSARYYKDGAEILIDRGWDMATGEKDFDDPLNQQHRPRRLTPRECARLMGFEAPGEAKFRIPVSDTQAYRQFGNSVVVPVFAAVAKLLEPKIKQAVALRQQEAQHGRRSR